RERLGIGLGAGGCDGDAAGIGVLDNDAGGCLEALDALPGRIGIGDVVVGELLALQLAIVRERTGGGLGVAIEGGGLVGVLAIAHVLHLVPLLGVHIGQGTHPAVGVVRARGQVVGDRGVVGGGMREYLLRQREPARG